MKVYSFVASGTLSSFSADVKDFFNHLESNENYPSSSQNLIGMIWVPAVGCTNNTNHPSTVFQVGTEAFEGGPATFRVSDFSATISY